MVYTYITNTLFDGGRGWVEGYLLDIETSSFQMANAQLSVSFEYDNRKSQSMPKYHEKRNNYFSNESRLAPVSSD